MNIFVHSNGNGPHHAGRQSFHGAGTPYNLIEKWIRYICPEGGIVCDPFLGSGTTALVARHTARNFIGIEIEEHFYQIAHNNLFGEGNES